IRSACGQDAEWQRRYEEIAPRVTPREVKPSRCQTAQATFPFSALPPPRGGGAPRVAPDATASGRTGALRGALRSLDASEGAHTSRRSTAAIFGAGAALPSPALSSGARAARRLAAGS